MQMSGVFLALGQDAFGDLLRHVSIGKLKTYQIFDRFKVRARLSKLNSETLRKSKQKFWERIEGGEDDFATELSQVLLLSHLDMIIEVLNFLEIPNQDGFFDKDLNPEQYLKEGWQDRVYQEFKDKYPQAVLLFYINHLDWELTKAETLYSPAT